MFKIAISVGFLWKHISNHWRLMMCSGFPFNSLSGAIPSSIGNLVNLTSLWVCCVIPMGSFAIMIYKVVGSHILHTVKWSPRCTLWSSLYYCSHDIDIDICFSSFIRICYPHVKVKWHKCWETCYMSIKDIGSYFCATSRLVPTICVTIINKVSQPHHNWICHGLELSHLTRWDFFRTPVSLIL